MGEGGVVKREKSGGGAKGHSGRGLLIEGCDWGDGGRVKGIAAKAGRRKEMKTSNLLWLHRLGVL